MPTFHGTSAPRFAIDVGIYGCTKAGKTRFLFQLLRHWEITRRLLSQSEACQKFLTTVETEIEKHGGSMPTVATTEGIRVTVRRDDKEPLWDLTFRDLRGELLSDELDNITSLVRQGFMPTQVKKCDAFLFFFDPSSSENRSDIDKHHERELKRARMFIDYVIKVRQNRYLPIIFVLTHLDRWENDANLSAKAEQWINEVHAKLCEVYHSGLRGLHPQSLVDVKHISHRVSSVRNTGEARYQLEKVLEHLVELVADSRSSQGQIQRTGRTALISGLGVLLLCFVFFIWFAQSPPRGLTPRSGESDSRLFVTNMSEAEIVKKLDELDGLLKAHPREGNLPTVEEARRLNRHLQWLVQRLDLESGEDKGLSDKTRQRMNAALNSITDLISKKYSANREISGNLTAVLAAYLEDLPDLEPRSKALSDLQANYWGLRRILIEQDIGSIIKRRRAVQSPPTDTLSEILEKLRNLEADVKRDKVFAKKVAGSSGTNLRQHLLNDIQTAVTFCEDRLKSKCYTAKLKITGHFKGVDECWRTLLIQSPGRNDVFSTDGISLKPLQDNGITVLTTKSSIYDVAFGLGVPVIMTLMVHQGQDQDGKDLWTKVSDFDISKHDGKIGPLEPMGLPLHRDKQYSRTFHWQPQGYELTITLTEMSPVPDLLWQAAEYAREKKP